MAASAEGVAWNGEPDAAARSRKSCAEENPASSSDSIPSGYRKRWEAYSISPETPNGSRLVARTERRCVPEQRLDKPAASMGDVLAVVEKKQRLRRPQVGAEDVDHVAVGASRVSQEPAPLRGERGGVGDPAQVDEADALAPSGNSLGGRKRESCLADAADTGHGHQARITEQRLELRQLMLAADEARQLHGQVAPRRWPHRRNVVAENGLLGLRSSSPGSSPSSRARSSRTRRYVASASAWRSQR